MSCEDVEYLKPYLTNTSYHYNRNDHKVNKNRKNVTIKGITFRNVFSSTLRQLIEKTYFLII